MVSFDDGKGQIVVFGIFNSKTQLDDVLYELTEVGFREADISTLIPDTRSTVNFSYERGSKAVEGATAGVTGGFALGGALGWMVGVGALAIPGIGPVLAAGPILLALAGAGVGGALGGVGGALVGLGIPAKEAILYEAFLKEGGMLVSVHVSDKYWEEKARTALADAGAQDISSCLEEKVYPGKGTEGDSASRKTSPTVPATGSAETPYPMIF